MIGHVIDGAMLDLQVIFPANKGPAVLSLTFAVCPRGTRMAAR